MLNQLSKGVSTLASAVVMSTVLGLSSFGAAHAVEVQLDNGDVIELDNAVVNTCRNEGLNLGACACVVSIMLEAEGLSSMSLPEMTRLANAYPREYEAARVQCISVN